MKRVNFSWKILFMKQISFDYNIQLHNVTYKLYPQDAYNLKPL
jgi:hypothetical protein